MLDRARFLLVAGFVLTIAGGSHAAPRVATPVAPSPDQSTLKQMTDSQKWLSEEVWKIKEQVEALPGVIAEAKEGHTETHEEVGKLRDEVKGLYVELSTVKQQIEALKGDIGSVNTNVSGFRTYSGFFLALMLLMVAVMFVMTIRR
jgi:peptidoglycan hydrolase CwlO-like protein